MYCFAKSSPLKQNFIKALKIKNPSALSYNYFDWALQKDAPEILSWFVYFLPNRFGAGHLILHVIEDVRARPIHLQPILKLLHFPIPINLKLSTPPNHPPTPKKVVRTILHLPRKLKFCMETLFNQTRSTSLLASHQLVSQKCRG